MTQQPDNRSPAGLRALNCPRCGTAFTCDLSGHCWCMDETAKLPVPIDGEDCLCPACLRAAGKELAR